MEEEDTIELADYLWIVWEGRGFIAVFTAACSTVAGIK